jgi:hypothetical protein
MGFVKSQEMSSLTKYVGKCNSFYNIKISIFNDDSNNIRLDLVDVLLFTYLVKVYIV